MHTDEDIRSLFERALTDVRPMADVVPAATRLGRRRRHARAASVAAIALVPLAVVGALGAAPSTRQAVQQWASGSTSTIDNPADHQRAFAERAAGLLQELLPQRLGEIRPAAGIRWGVNSGDGPYFGSYLATGAQGRFAVTFTVKRLPADIGGIASGCVAHEPKAATVSCVQGRLADGTTVRAVHEVDGGTTRTYPIAEFHYGDALVLLALFPAGATSVPISDAELLQAVTDPRFVDIVDDWAGDPSLLEPVQLANATSTTGPAIGLKAR